MISKLFSVFRKKEKPASNVNPHVNADFVVQRFGSGTSNSRAVREVGRILAKRFKDIKPHGFGTEVSGKLKDVEAALGDIAKHSTVNQMREQVELRLDLNPAKDRKIAERIASIAA